MQRFKTTVLATITFMAFGNWPASAAEPTATADVIVYGATPGGFCAAIAAAREGAKVILLEPTSHVGGVNTGGLCFSDSNQTIRSTVMGLFDEWHTRIEKEYQDRGVKLPYKVSEKDHTHWTYEPHVAAKITKQMLDEAGVRVLTERILKNVVKEGPRITRLETSEGTFTAKVFVDGTYEGDLMAAAGVKWTIGREGRKDFGESLAGKQYPKKPIPVSGLGDDGKPLPLITTTGAGEDEAGDKNVMVYSFRLCLTKEPGNRVPFPKPANYDPARFEVVRRYYAQEKNPQLLWDLYPLPGNKYDANNGIGKQFSMGLVGGCNGWSEADPAGRAKIWEAHKQYTLELYQFLTTDPSVPEKLRVQMAALGLCKDEFPANGHWSPQLYVREGRRMIGEHILTQNDIMKEPKKEDPIVVSSFPIDSHDCQRVGTKDKVLNEGTIMPVRMAGSRHGYPYHVPYRAIVPKATECDNLLVPVALSCTHVGLSSIRVEPTWMILGQSAGIAAAMSANKNLAVQKLPYADLRVRLLAQKQMLELPAIKPMNADPNKGPKFDAKSLEGIVLDDTKAKLQGEWKQSTNFKPYVGDGYRSSDESGDGKAVATFRFRAPAAGSYEIRMAYSPHATRAKKVPVVVQSGSRKVEFSVDQTVPHAKGEVFRSLGRVELDAGADSIITVSNAGAAGFVILDAIQLIPKK